MRTYFSPAKTMFGIVLFALVVLGMTATPAGARTMTDQEISDAIEDEFIFDRAINANNIDVSVTQGIATLSGSTNNLLAKERAAKEISDKQIAKNTRDAMIRDPYVEKFEINVSVSDGTAYLSGTVDSYFEKAQADDIAARINGVTQVRNNLDVDYTGPLAYDPYVYDENPYLYDWYDYEPLYTFETDAEIKEEINDEMWWSPFVDSDDVTVTVDDGTATLTGTVDSWSEFNAATENAFEGGAVWVDNNLTVE